MVAVSTTTQAIERYRMKNKIDRRCAAVAMNTLSLTKNLFADQFVVTGNDRMATWNGSYAVQFTIEQNSAFCAKVMHRDASSAFLEFTYNLGKYAFGFVFPENEARVVFPESASDEDRAVVRDIVQEICSQKVGPFTARS